MASFISGLSLFILVLINGCFTLPIDETHFPEFTESPFYDDLTTEKSFISRAVTDNEVFTTAFNNIKQSGNEEIFSQTETNPTVFTGIKRSLPESDRFDVTVGTIQFESSTDVSRQARISKEPSKVSGTTGRSTTVSEGLETHPSKHGLQVEDTTTNTIAKSSQPKVFSQITTSVMPLFTSTSSAVAPQLYTSQFKPIRTSAGKYVGSLKDPADDSEERKADDDHSNEDTQQENAKPKKEEKHREEEYRHKTIVNNTYKKVGRQNKRPTPPSQTSDDQPSGETYMVGELFDQGSSNFRPTLPSSFAILDESVIPVTAGLLRSSTITTTASNEENKLNQGKEST